MKAPRCRPDPHGYRSSRVLSSVEIAAIPHALLTYNFLVSHWFVHIGHLESVEIEVRCLEWLHRNFERICAAVAGDPSISGDPT